MSVPNNRNHVEQAISGVCRSIVGFPCEYPFINLKARAQGTPSLTAYEAIRQVSSPIDLYKGAAATLARRITREAIRWPAVGVYDQFLRRHNLRRELYNQLSLGTGIATMDTFLFLPFDRLTLTQVNESGYRAFYHKIFLSEGFRSLYHGFGAAYSRNMITWLTLIPANRWCQKQVSRLDPNQQHPIAATAAATSAIAGFITLITMPSDFICTRIQLDPTLQNKSYLSVTRNLFRKYGIRGFYAGTSFSFVSMSFFVLFTGQLLNRFTTQK